MGLATTIDVITVGRFVVGTGVGIASSVVPIFLAEIAPTAVRGRVVTASQLAITFGQFSSYFVCLAVKPSWRLMLGLAVAPAALQFLGMLWLPESPRWLMKHGREDMAEEVMAQFINRETDEGRDEIAKEMLQMRERLAKEGNLSIR